MQGCRFIHGMQKTLQILGYALVSLGRRWAKHVSLVMVYALVVGLMSSVLFLTASLRYETHQVLSDLPALWVQKLAGGRLIPMPRAFADSLRNIRGVRKVIPRTWGYAFDAPTGAVFTIVGFDSAWVGMPQLSTAFAGKLADGEAVCGTGFLALRGLRVGEALTLQDSEGEIRSFRIVGSFEAASDLLTKDLVVLSSASAAQLIGLPEGYMTDVALDIPNPLETDNIGRKIDRRFGGIRVVTLGQLQSTYQTLFSWRGGIFLFGALVVIPAFLMLAWDRATGLDAEERRELGILKGIGWGIPDVLWLKVAEGLAVSLTATLLGMVLGFAHIFLLDAVLLKPFFVGWSVLYPAYELTPYLQVGDFLVIGLLSIAPYLVAVLIPAWYGAMTDPTESLR